MAAARFTYRLGPGVLGTALVLEIFLTSKGWQKEQTQGGEVVASVIRRWESGEIRGVVFTFRGGTFTVGQID